MKNIILLLFLVLIAFSCKSKRNLVTTNTTTKHDTIYIEKETKITPPAREVMIVEDPCDSITGVLRDFERTVVSGENKVVVRSLGGIIRTEVRISGSTDTMEREFRSSMENQVITIEVPVEVNKPWKSKWFWISIAINLVFLLSLIRKFTKWIPFFPI